MKQANLMQNEEIQNLDAEILDFSAFRAKRHLRGKVRGQAFEMLKVVQGLIFDYEAQMLTIADEVEGEEWVAQHGRSAAEQIADDIRRLSDVSAALEHALREEGAATLGQAAAWIRQNGSDELVATLEYILASDYVGFQAITKILEAVYLTESEHFFNIESVVSTWKELEAAGFEYGVGPIAAICFDEALPV